ncbi:hypothetical protein DFH09DRAFT_66136 [Mycena vulgaris]|nr:hypothetical protein DFH09DRAFT_66136 [Mycena vulgaris]
MLNVKSFSLLAVVFAAVTIAAPVIDNDNTTWETGVAREAGGAALVDAKNTGWEIGQPVPTEVTRRCVLKYGSPACLSPRAEAVDAENTAWGVGEPVPTPVARAEALPGPHPKVEVRCVLKPGGPPCLPPLASPTPANIYSPPLYVPGSRCRGSQRPLDD